MKKTFIIPMAFIAASSISIGTGLIVNNVNAIDNTESVIVSNSLKQTPILGGTITLGEVTKDTIKVTTNWTNATDNEVSRIKYEVWKVGEDFSTAESETVKDLGPDSSNTFVVGGGKDILPLEPETNYWIQATFMKKNNFIYEGIETTDPITVKTLEANPSPIDMVMTNDDSTNTDTSITIDTTYLDGALDTANSSSYTISEEETIVETKSGNPTAGADTVTFTNLDPGIEYTIAGNITSDAGAVLVAEEIKATTKTWMTTTALIKSPENTSDTSIGVESSWTNGTLAGQEVTNLTYTATLVDGVTSVPLKNQGNFTVNSQANSHKAKLEGTEDKPLTVNTEYIISVSFKNGNAEIGTPLTLRTNTSIANNGKLQTDEDSTETAIGVIFSWLDGTDPFFIVDTITYTATLKRSSDEGQIALKDAMDVKVTPGEQSHRITLEGIEGTPLTANTSYEITATFKNEFGREIGYSTIDAKTKGSSTEAANASGFNAGEITGIVIGSVAGASILGAGGYWAYNNQIANHRYNKWQNNKKN